jgi:hypothetical protein
MEYPDRLKKLKIPTLKYKTSRPVSEDKSARKRGLVGPYVKTTRTVLLFYNIEQIFRAYKL